jgi:hypothetical protein
MSRILGDAPSTDASEGSVTVTIDGCRVEVCDSEGKPLDQRWRDTLLEAAERDRNWHADYQRKLRELSRLARQATKRDAERADQFLQSIERLKDVHA